jgi:hypothetical protein
MHHIISQSARAFCAQEVLMRRVLVLAMVLALAAASPVGADSVKIGVNIGLPSPPAVVIAPPPPPVVIAAPPYYSLHEGAWFVATTHGGPWVTIAAAKVPQPVLAVPVAYYKVPPGHAKKMHRDGGPGRGCPPGLAKQGRC